MQEKNDRESGEISAQTTEEALTDSETARDAEDGQEGENSSEAAFSEGSEGEDKPEGDESKESEPKADKPAKQDDRTNAENARRRREAEQRKALKTARMEATMEALGGINPYTSEPMTDEADYEEYLEMRQIAKDGGDPVRDFAKHQKTKARDAAEKARAAENTEKWYSDDRESFAREYPGVKLDELARDENFLFVAEGKIGKMPLSEIYRGYLKFTRESKERAEDKAAQEVANSRATPGALAGAKAGGEDFFTKEQVEKMTPAEVHKHYDKIRASMQKWK